MDNSAPPAHTHAACREQPAEMSNPAPAAHHDPTFDWQGFKDFLLEEENFDTILNALQIDENAHRLVHQQQVHAKLHLEITKCTLIHLLMSSFPTLVVSAYFYGPWSILWLPDCCSSSPSRLMGLMEHNCVFSRVLECNDRINMLHFKMALI